MAATGGGEVQEGEEEEEPGPEGEEGEEEETEGYEEETDADADADTESDTGEGSVTEMNRIPPVYDEETQRLIDLADEARQQYVKADQELRTVEQELKNLSNQLEKDYGNNDEYAILQTTCYKFEDREYVYTLCPFDRTAQQPRGGGSETNLGRWEDWWPLDEKKYARQRYLHGASCWNGPQRSTAVNLRCGLKSRIIAVSEPNRCEYLFEFETPAACDDASTFKEMEQEQQQQHHPIRDEL